MRVFVIAAAITFLEVDVFFKQVGQFELVGQPGYEQTSGHASQLGIGKINQSRFFQALELPFCSVPVQHLTGCVVVNTGILPEQHRGRSFQFLLPFFFKLLSGS